MKGASKIAKVMQFRTSKLIVNEIASLYSTSDSSNQESISEDVKWIEEHIDSLNIYPIDKSREYESYIKIINNHIIKYINLLKLSGKNPSKISYSKISEIRTAYSKLNVDFQNINRLLEKANSNSLNIENEYLSEYKSNEKSIYAVIIFFVIGWMIYGSSVYNKVKIREKGSRDTKEKLLFLNKQLEIKVKERTEDLRRSNLVLKEEIAKRKSAENQTNKLNNSLTMAYDRLKSLSRQLIKTQEVEQRNLAKELHDEVGQNLTALKISLLSVCKVFNIPQTDPKISSSLTAIEMLLNNIRNMSLNLRPSILDDLGLIPALRWLVEKQLKSAKIEGEVYWEDIEADERFSEDIEITAFRIVQESITNIIKHSEATLFRVKLNRQNQFLIINIMDNGKGFSTEEYNSENFYSSMGIMGMVERADLIGGGLKINSVPGKGTTVNVIIPLKFPES